MTIVFEHHMKLSFELWLISYDSYVLGTAE